MDDANEVNFFHKQSLQNHERVVLRNAKETAKAIRIIKQIQNETDWAKHLKFDDLEVLRKEIISGLIDSEKSFLEIKKQYL